MKTFTELYADTIMYLLGKFKKAIFLSYISNIPKQEYSKLSLSKK